MSEEDIKKEYAEAGVDLPELKDAPKEKAEEDTPEPAPEPAKAEDKEPLQDQPKEPRKRSIYDDYKEQKGLRKSAEERAEAAETRAAELQALIDAGSAPKADAAAAEDAVSYAEKIGADPALVKRIIEDARKGFKAETDPEVAKRLERFEAWEKTNSKVIEQQMFNEEFDKVAPALASFLPAKPSADELKAIKDELDRISHTKEWHDKDLEYVAFKHKDTLSALVSPKKRGMESKERKAEEASDYEFDPQADYSKLSPTEKVKWEKEYKKLTSNEGLLTDANGKKLIL